MKGGNADNEGILDDDGEDEGLFDVRGPTKGEDK